MSALLCWQGSVFRGRIKVKGLSADRQPRFRGKSSGMIYNTDCINIKRFEIAEGVGLCCFSCDEKRQELEFEPKNNTLAVGYCSSGRCEVSADSRIYSASAGDIMIGMISKPGSIYFPAGHVCGWALIFEREKTERSLSAFIRELNISLADIYRKFGDNSDFYTGQADEGLSFLFRGIQSLIEQNDMLYLKLKAAETLLLIKNIDTAQEKIKPVSLSMRETAQTASEYICTHTGVRITINQLAKVCGVSETQVKKSIRAVYGMPVYSYVRRQKMNSAAELLIDTDKTILDIAGECGYDNGSKFSRAFFSVYGITPSSYRKLYKN